MECPSHQMAAGALVRKNDRILLIHNPRRGWEFPGGQVDIGESVPETLLREVFEETGINVRITDFVGVYTNTTRKIGYGIWEGILLPPVTVFSFLCEYVSGEPTTSEESDRVQWFTVEEARSLVTWPTFAERLEDMLAYQGIPVFVKWHVGDNGAMVTDERQFIG